ncbi:hypothetical protein GALMADRAFT_407778 [Galerina marginata CBS 339.88]|uniref:Uncharacterized protein n=1 Tax=Galerina marginata (strain CBS 339.88) TaxID=685588 RepID=A0A067TCF2_GALM3|nr:hypothetical protein GALMADRAFT_407778 [Galerina marginata CBS 339.88]
MMSTFDVSAYNALPFIAAANTRFEKQLETAGLTRTQFFTKLVPLFREASYAGNYSVCLIHRHYSLNDGERMVTTGDSAKPSMDTSENIVGERWASNGQVIEHKFTDDPASHPPPPPAEFFSKFKSIVDAHGVDILGVSYAPGKLEDDFLLLESPGPGDREQVTTVVHRLSEERKHGFEAAWIPRFDSKRGFYTMGGCSNCSPCDCPPPEYRITLQVEKFGITI